MHRNLQINSLDILWDDLILALPLLFHFVSPEVAPHIKYLNIIYGRVKCKRISVRTIKERPRT